MVSSPGPAEQGEADPPRERPDIPDFRSMILARADRHFAKAQMFAYKAFLPDISADAHATYAKLVADHRVSALALVEAAKVADEIEEVIRLVRDDINRIASDEYQS